MTAVSECDVAAGRLEFLGVAGTELGSAKAESEVAVASDSASVDPLVLAVTLGLAFGDSDTALKVHQHPAELAKGLVLALLSPG